MAVRRRKSLRRGRKPQRHHVKRRVKRSLGKKGAFGGYKVNFRGCKDSLKRIFGTKPLTPSQMTKKLWGYVKRKRLANM